MGPCGKLFHNNSAILRKNTSLRPFPSARRTGHSSPSLAVGLFFYFVILPVVAWIIVRILGLK
jgi:hypothetical protein